MINRERDRDNHLNFILTGFEEELNRVCKGVDKKLKRKIVGKIYEVIRGDFYYDMLDDITDEVHEDFLNKGISKDNIYDIADSYMDWLWSHR